MYTFLFTPDYLCEHKRKINDCEICNKIEGTHVPCQHQEIGFLCKTCYKYLISDDEEKIPYVVWECINDLPSLKILKKRQSALYNIIIKEYPIIQFPKLHQKKEKEKKQATNVEVPSSTSSSSSTSQCERKEESPPKDEETPEIDQPTMRRKNHLFQFEGNLKCQHNRLLSSCNLSCAPVSLADLKDKAKCLHRIPIFDCNHCKQLILILRKEKEYAPFKTITKADYIALSLYEILYLNPNNKKPIQHKKPKIEEKSNINQNQISKDKPKLTQDTNSELDNAKTKRDFKILTEEMETDSESINTQDKNKNKNPDPKDNNSNEKVNNLPESNTPDPKIRKPPPIFILKEKPQEIKKLLEGYNLENFSLKVVSNKQIKVKTKTLEEFKFFSSKLVDLGVEHYSFQPFQGKIVRRIIRGLPVDFNLGTLKLELEKFEFLVVKNITQLRHNVTKHPIPLYRIDFKSHLKLWEKLDNIKTLNNYEVNFDRLGIKQPEIPICKVCLNYGHIKNYCKAKLVCLICNDNHHSKTCPIPETATNKNEVWKPTCLHCKEAHFTTWKGCKVYKKLRQQRIDKYKKINEECKKMATEEKDLTDVQVGELKANNKNLSYIDEIKRLKSELKTSEKRRIEEISQLKKDISSLKNEIVEIKLMLKN
ncbi:unnamed protein product [Bemisia tabaci]|uniref:Pre-C2HC domain-containing protein n=1 Tax=Bemisia tabaci TaxID=7038 RepID=A0A9N9ZZC9_BEMTA|nr:unnamed protein product [Bemisia tabaci]